ncbi:hypothetical protein Tco_1178484 [Tanacetum coccineum]
MYNYVALSMIPCSPECKIVGKILLDHPLSYALTAIADVPSVYLQQFWQTVHKVPNTKDTIRFKLDTQKITYTLDMFRATLKLPVEIPDNPFVAPVTIEIIESFMNKVGYQCVVDKKKEAIQYPRFIKLMIANLMKKFPNIPQRIDEDYHSIKDDIPLVKEIRSTDDFKKYETVFVRVDVPMNQSQPVVSTQGTRMSTPRTHRTPTVSTASPHRKKRKPTAGESSSPLKLLKIIIRQKQKLDEEEIEKIVEGEGDAKSYASEFANSMINDDVDDSGTKIEPGSHKEHPKNVTDDDEEIKKEKKDEGIEKEKKDKEIEKEKNIDDVEKTDEVVKSKYIDVATATKAQENIAKVQEKLDEEEIEKMVEGDEDEESYASEFADSMINDDVDDSGTKIEPGSHKEHLEIVNDDDDQIEKEKNNEEIKKVKKHDDDEKIDEVVMEKDDDDDVEKVDKGVKEKSNVDVATGKRRCRHQFPYQLDPLGKFHLLIKQLLRN